MSAKTYSLKHNAVRAARKTGLTAEQANKAARQDDAGAWYIDDGIATAFQNDNDKAAYEAAKAGEPVKAAVEATKAEAPEAPLPQARDFAAGREPGRGAGLARMRANADSEALRAAVLADQQAALAKASRVVDASPEASARRKAAATVRIEAQPAPAPKAEKAAKPAREGEAKRAPKFAAEMKIAALVANPKKPGSRAHAVYSLYREGLTVSAFIAACTAAGITETDARANISWDARKGFITLG